MVVLFSTFSCMAFITDVAVLLKNLHDLWDQEMPTGGRHLVVVFSGMVATEVRGGGLQRMTEDFRLSPF